jgi:ABC-2 type transport system ATP-binding protein
MIQVERLSRSYDSLRAVAEVSFAIGHGEVVGLLGHNGAGKTTIMKMLTGFLEPSAGSIRIDGQDIETRRQAVQSLIGYLPENCPLYPEMTVIDYLDYQAGLHGVPAEQRPGLIRRAIARTWLETKALEPIATLSRGYRQRVGVAQAILHRPKLLILDEPTNGLDPTQIQQMRTLIRDLAREATVILSTHILQEVQAVCDRVLILRAGALVLDARLADLNTTRQLSLVVDRSPAAVEPLLRTIPIITAIQHCPTTADRHEYLLDLDLGAAAKDPLAIAPQVAQTVTQGGCQLFTLQPRSRDLETLFRELDDQPLGEARHG